ncbi:MAG: hypothetical protein WC698_05480 [Candidatus Peribacteraceae bacterium]|jgi:hypothetical protein
MEQRRTLLAESRRKHADFLSRQASARQHGGVPAEEDYRNVFPVLNEVQEEERAKLQEASRIPGNSTLG